MGRCSRSVVTSGFALLQLGGTRLSGNVQNGASIGIGLIVVSLAIALFYGFLANGGTVDAPASISFSGTPGMAAIGLTVAAVVFTYDGWYAASYFSGEVKSGGRAVAIGSLQGAAIIMALYVLLNLALVLSVPLPALAGHKLALAGALDLVIGAGAGTIILLAAVFILLAHQNLQYMIASRILYSLSADGLGSRHATGVSDKGTPAAAVIFSWLLVVVSDHRGQVRVSAEPGHDHVHGDVCRADRRCVPPAAEGAGGGTALSRPGLPGHRHHLRDRLAGRRPVRYLHQSRVGAVRAAAGPGLGAGLPLPDAPRPLVRIKLPAVRAGEESGHVVDPGIARIAPALGEDDANVLLRSASTVSFAGGYRCCRLQSSRTRFALTNCDRIDRQFRPRGDRLQRFLRRSRKIFVANGSGSVLASAGCQCSRRRCRAAQSRALRSSDDRLRFFLYQLQATARGSRTRLSR